ncbi:MAG: hypothetical protein GWP91_18190 [Rhodobacterales bacterium]|nr:hypothetical protein [Rhodobacterales bacterium]
MRNLLALVTFAALGTASWLSIAPKNASACSCIGPMLRLEFREVALVKSTRPIEEQYVQLDNETLRWPETAHMSDWGMWNEDWSISLDHVE